MAIQFFNGQILFDSGEVAMDPACCCDTGGCPTDCSDCCEAPNYYKVTSRVRSQYPPQDCVSNFIDRGHMLESGTCEWEGAVPPGTFNNVWLQSFNPPVAFNDIINWHAHCVPGEGWQLQLRTEALQVLATAYAVVTNSSTGAIVTDQEPPCPAYEPTAAYALHFEYDSIADEPVLTTGSTLCRPQLSCQAEDPPTPCLLDAYGGSCAAAYSNPLQIRAYSDDLFDVTSCTCDDAYASNPWNGGLILKQPQCVWEVSSGDLSGKTIGGKILQEVKIVPVEDDPPGDCGLYLEIWCQNELVWRGLKKYSGGAPPFGTAQGYGRYDYIEGCSPIPSELYVDRMMATYQYCASDNLVVDVNVAGNPGSTPTCPGIISTDFQNVQNATGAPADLYTASLVVDDDVAVDGIPHGPGCPAAYTMTNILLKPNVPDGGIVKLQAVDTKGGVSYLRGTVEYRTTFGGIPSTFSALYKGQYVRQAALCAEFVGWLWAYPYPDVKTVVEDVSCNNPGQPCA